MGDQRFAGFVLQVFVGGSGDLDWQVVGLRHQVAGSFHLNSEHDLSHAGGMGGWLTNPADAAAAHRVALDTHARSAAVLRSGMVVMNVPLSWFVLSGDSPHAASVGDRHWSHDSFGDQVPSTLANTTRIWLYCL
jgi:hypothetical protein